MTAEAALRRALVVALADTDVTANIGNIQSRPWASATFTGMRHEMRVRLSGARVDALISGVGEREFDLPGHILIDIAATEIGREGKERVLMVEALTVIAD